MDILKLKLKVYVIVIIFSGVMLLCYFSININIPEWDSLLLWTSVLILAEIIPVTVPQIGAAISIDSAIR